MTTNEKTLPQTTKSGAPVAPLVGGNTVSAIVPRDIEQTFRLAQAISAAGFAPKGYMVDPKDASKGFDANKIVVGIMHGMELGMTPMAALQSIAVVNGMPTIWGDGALGLVRASGLLEDFKEEFDGDDIAICTVKRKGQPSPLVRTFSRADAQKAGLAGKQGPWQSYPKRMMQMRARSWALRDAFADILRGLGIREEVEDMQTLEQGTDGTYTPTPPRPSRAQFEQQAQQVADHAAQVSADPPPPAPEPASEADPWLISPEAFPSLGKFSDEWRRQLEEVCAAPEDVNALLDANATRLEAWAADRSSKAAVGALQADADARRAYLAEAA